MDPSVEYRRSSSTNSHLTNQGLGPFDGLFSFCSINKPPRPIAKLFHRLCHSLQFRAADRAMVRAPVKLNAPCHICTDESGQTATERFGWLSVCVAVVPMPWPDGYFDMGSPLWLRHAKYVASFQGVIFYTCCYPSHGNHLTIVEIRQTDMIEHAMHGG